MAILYCVSCALLTRAEMISSTNFENFIQGMPLSRTSLQSNGFQTGEWDNSLATRTLIDTTQSKSGLQSVRITYPKNEYGPEGTGCQVQLKFESRNEAYASYCLRFSENFSWGTTSYGGKLPGLSGGKSCSGGDNCDGTNGFSARLMWRTGGKAVLYLYHMDKPDKYGEDHDLVYPNGNPVVFERGKWYHVAERVKINKDGSTYDGEVEVWIDGHQVLLRKGLRFTSNGDKVDDLYISTFHGGADETWCPTDTCYTWIDDIRIGTTYEDVAYQDCRKPDLGNDQTLCTGAKSYSFTSDSTSKNVNYQWLHNGKVISKESAISVWDEGIYTLIVDSAWCSGRDTVRLLPSLPVDLGGDKHICQSSFLELSSGLDENPVFDFEWEKNGVKLNENGASIKVKDAGMYTLSVSTQRCATVVDSVNVTSGLLPVLDVEGEENDLVTLRVEASGDFAWYEDPSLQKMIEAGSICNALIPHESTYVYVKDVSSFSGHVGKRNLTANAWTRTDFSEWMVFTVKRELTIDSLSIYPTKDLTAVIRILDNQTGEVVSTQTFENLSPGENRLFINVTLSPGKYRMDAQGTTGALYHSHTDADIAFPYEVEGVISIDGANLAWINNKPWYLYFYNWKISVGNTCAATPVMLKPIEKSEFFETKVDRVSIYPKYTDGDLHIEGLCGKSQITIIAPSGYKVLSRRMKQSNAYFYVSEWKSGTYMILIEDEKGVYSSQFIKF